MYLYEYNEYIHTHCVAIAEAVYMKLKAFLVKHRVFPCKIIVWSDTVFSENLLN